VSAKRKLSVCWRNIAITLKTPRWAKSLISTIRILAPTRETLQNSRDRNYCVPVPSRSWHAVQFVDLAKIADCLHVTTVHSPSHASSNPDQRPTCTQATVLLLSHPTHRVQAPCCGPFDPDSRSRRTNPAHNDPNWCCWRGLWLRRRSTASALIYNPLGKLIGITRTFTFADGH
jgi:hypothetical protein